MAYFRCPTPGIAGGCRLFALRLLPALPYDLSPEMIRPWAPSSFLPSRPWSCLSVPRGSP